jgi:hypothetical protein
MTTNKREDQSLPPDESIAQDDGASDLDLRPILAEEMLAINCGLLLLIERENEERQALAEQFDQELSALLSLITPTDGEPEEEDIGPDPPDWPAF